MSNLEELHVKDVKIRSLAMGQFLLHNLPRLRRASNWVLDIHDPNDQAEFKRALKEMEDANGLRLEYREF